ncbi:glycosyltransferase [Actinomadura miaoliensis]|uniref:Glycosyltransferase n=1 Tax=Actinomadura miaoliensis TaxID=430685 RepID=A0ABP7W812_9ACTN
MEIVIVPAWRRPDFLVATLRRLALADDDQLVYWVCLDRGHDPELEPVVEAFAATVGRSRVQIRRRFHGYAGNSYNVLESYREACAWEPRLVHLIEEDVLVGRDYFAFHRRAHALVPDAFCVSACRNQQLPLGTDPPADDGAVYRHVSYQSLGVSFRPDRLSPVLTHAGPGYFADPVGYCRSVFPGSRIPASNAEQDGLLHRVLEADGMATVYPAVPRAYHAGFVGYHRRGRPVSGSLEQRAEQILTMDAQQLNTHAPGEFRDHTVIGLDDERAPVKRVIDWP